MYKRGFAVFIALILSLSFAIAQENNSDIQNSPEVDPDAELKEGAGITPDSSFYFIEDKILTKFRDDISNREKKFAEIREMINQGNVEDARKALVKYYEYADRLEKEVNPEDKEEAQRSASAIRNALKELESTISQENKEEFINKIEDKEGKIATAAEIASKIQELCETLSKIDPDKYATTCKTKDDAPKWQRNLDQKLTKDQEKEAEEFFRVMSKCFRDPKTCQCDKISVKSFAEECKVVAPLAAKCMEGDESACKEMDSRPDPSELLPPHLQHVMESVEEEFSDAEFDNHFPPECREAKATTKEACMKVMFELNAPEECIEALKAGKIDFKDERQARMQCEEIMFLENAPEECIEAGIKDGRECGKYMFKQSAPQECLDAGLTGDRGSDHKKCEAIMKEKRGTEGPNGGSGRGPGSGMDCRKIEDKDEKLKCFENAFSDTQQGSGDFNDRNNNQRGGGNFPKECI